jgi:hypothetical protein
MQEPLFWPCACEKSTTRRPIFDVKSPRAGEGSGSGSGGGAGLQAEDGSWKRKLRIALRAAREEATCLSPIPVHPVLH